MYPNVIKEYLKQKYAVKDSFCTVNKELDFEITNMGCKQKTIQIFKAHKALTSLPQDQLLYTSQSIQPICTDLLICKATRLQPAQSTRLTVHLRIYHLRNQNVVADQPG
jgi:hypothetical protein